jgi:tetratricopeptide (TPR) repeat protein
MIKESNKKDVEARLASMGDYVKIDYLAELLNGNLDYDTRRFVLLKLARLYKDKGMLAEAAKLVVNAADINTTYDAMMRDYSVAMQLFIQGDKFDEADIALNKAMVSCNTEGQKSSLRAKRKEALLARAADLVKKDKRKHAMIAYEKILTLPDVTADDKKVAQQNLSRLYEQLGKVKEFYGLKRSM